MCATANEIKAAKEAAIQAAKDAAILKTQAQVVDKDTGAGAAEHVSAEDAPAGFALPATREAQDVAQPPVLAVEPDLSGLAPPPALQDDGEDGGDGQRKKYDEDQL